MSFSEAKQKLWPILVLQGTSDNYAVLLYSAASVASPVPLVVLVVLSQQKPETQQIGQVFLAITRGWIRCTQKMC